MDRVVLRTNAELDLVIRDRIIQYLLEQEPEHPYHAALAAILHILWQSKAVAAGAKSKPSYLPLPCLCGQALGRCSAATVAINAAWGLLYMASFILDKIEDQEVGHPIFSRFSVSVAVNLASGLILYTERILSEMEPEQPGDAVIIEEIRRIFPQSAIEVCAGQHLDLTLQEPSLNQAWEILDAKSGKFFALGAYLGARLATNNPAYLEAFTKVGRHLGILIQIKNDLYGLKKVGGTGSDLASGKRTLPVQYALHVLPGVERDRLVAYLKLAPNDPFAEEEARKIILSAGVIVYLSLEAEKHKQQAINALIPLKLSPELTNSLFELLAYANQM